ncbi:MAG: PIG-L family deacetylase [Acidobacteriota bacterium]
MRKSRILALALAVGFTLAFGWAGIDRFNQTVDGPEILEEMRAFNVLGTILYISAHPDDENTQLITYCAKGRRYRTAYLSITRGDGGQNVIGPEFDEALGLLRTQELLAARRLDGGRQFFTRAIDFGYSKSAEETLKIWDRKQVLGDVVRVIRMFRPDVVVTRFSPEDGNTHGHHTASAILALEAFRLAGDPDAYPEQLDSLDPWKPARLLQNVRGRAGGDTIRIPVDGQDPLSGKSFADIAGESRSMHKSQGFDNFGGRFGRGGAAFESFTVLDGDPAAEDIFDGIDATWTRVPGGDRVALMADATIAGFDPDEPAKSVPALLELRRTVAALPGDPLVNEKRADLDRIIVHCLGLTVGTLVGDNTVVPGEEFGMQHTATLRSDIIPVRWTGVHYSDSGFADIKVGVGFKPREEFMRKTTLVMPMNAPLSQPYWLRLPHGPGIYRVENPELIGLAENPPDIPVEFEFEIDGQKIFIPDEPYGMSTPLVPGEQLRVVPPVRLQVHSNILLFAPGKTRTVEVTATAEYPDVQGSLHLEVPEGWSVKPSAQDFGPAAFGASAEFNFEVTAPNRAAEAKITAWIDVDGRSYSNGKVSIRYDHIPPQLLQPEAGMKAVSFSLEKRGERVAYVPGAGDSVAESLSEMGYEVTKVDAADISKENLEGFDAVVIGIRAFETEDAMKSKVPVLFEYAKEGGTVVVQYNRENGLDSAPLPLRISRNRVTVETAPVTFLAPDHPALNTPNKITEADFEGWVQERSIYVPDQWDDAYVPIVSSNDPGEGPLKGQLLVAQYGKGYFVYTTFVFFRELPAGVPGAYRLFANLVSLGKE